ncbi:pyocin knob domain-containing protein [Romboutsia lituseburensis]|uniref:pyocin knob domain-containing protein n=1 Tax=Romboutsia lituseburensis TaxID=1537 RepID=UPI00215A6F44|nr:pyocin knob domain-containing protein [Romboutsia lituseburensis]MCR8744333.1 pyocin knob domain-containing protein [Romboutsia lituseburensis]
MEKSFVFNSVNGDRKYKADDFRDYFASFIGNGVFPNPSTQLQVITNNDMTVTVTPGKSFIKGAIYENTDNLILKLDNADGVLNRVDRVVLRFDNLERNITCKIKQGTFASSSVATILQRDADAHELCIAEIKIDAGTVSVLQSKITDTRLNKDLCGIVKGTIEEIDTTTLYNQLQAYIKEKNLDMNKWIEESKHFFESDFNKWFEEIKNILDENVAGNLLNKITALETIVNNLTANSIKMSDGSTVESSISKSQRVKVTADDGTCNNTTDCNSITKTGFYMGSNVANAPDTGWYYFITKVHNNKYQHQEAIAFNNPTVRYVRELNNSTWSPWRRL